MARRGAAACCPAPGCSASWHPGARALEACRGQLPWFFFVCVQFFGDRFLGVRFLGVPPTSRSTLVRLRCETLEHLVLPCWFCITHSAALRAVPKVGRSPSGFLTSAPTQPLVIEPGSPHGNLPLSFLKHRPHQHSTVSKTRNGHPLA